MKTITVKDKPLALKYTLRSFFVFENLSGHVFAYGKLLDEYLLFYAFLLANNEGFDVTFDDFINECDNDPSLFSQFKEFLLKEIELQAQVSGETNDVKKKTKKKP